MNWEAIGVVAEIVGALAVVITLIYLSVQLRLGREATQAQSSYATIDMYESWRSHLIENAQLAGIVARANRGEPLTDEEQIRVSDLMDDLFIALAVSQATGARTEALYDRSAEREYVRRTFSKNPGLAPFWEQTRDYIHIMGPDFAKQIDSLMAETSFPLHPERPPPNKSLESDA